MTSPAVDLSNLREMTQGDVALEKELFSTFISESQLLIEGLIRSAGDPAAVEEWRRNAHACKGISRNLGADRLGDLCYEAQTKFEAGPEEKAALLQQIRAEYAEVIAFLQPLV